MVMLLVKQNESKKSRSRKKHPLVKKKRNKWHRCILKLRVVPANQQITKCMPKKQEGENMWYSNCCVSTRGLSQESLKRHCYLSARSTGIFKRQKLSARSLQTKTQKGERPNGNLYDFLFLPKFTKFPQGQSQERSRCGAFSKISRSWETAGRNLRDSGPGCDHHFMCPCQRPSILTACVGSPPGPPSCTHGSSSAAPSPCTANRTHLMGRATADQAFLGWGVNEPAASLTVRLAPSALSSNEVEKQPSNCRAVTCPHVNMAFLLPNLLKFGHVGRSFPLKINAIFC